MLESQMKTNPATLWIKCCNLWKENNFFGLKERRQALNCNFQLRLQQFLGLLHVLAMVTAGTQDNTLMILTQDKINNNHLLISNSVKKVAIKLHFDISMWGGSPGIAAPNSCPQGLRIFRLNKSKNRTFNSLSIIQNIAVLYLLLLLLR